jgi:hypothetical protein
MFAVQRAAVLAVERLSVNIVTHTYCVPIMASVRAESIRTTSRAR